MLVPKLIHNGGQIWMIPKCCGGGEAVLNLFLNGIYVLLIPQAMAMGHRYVVENFMLMNANLGSPWSASYLLCSISRHNLKDLPQDLA